ncbi:MAG: ATP-binding protein [Pyrinomonadaceae bacterium MAG19_C2-C3]|nr:ATP-binding protein [Pyrinomonadaceae bacterium MAG19_C2-C3]
MWLNLLVNAAHAVHAQVTRVSREAVHLARNPHTDLARANLNSHGKITITTRREDDRVCIKISDSGCGIAPEHIKKIFDPFFTTKPVGEGTGLGLSITYGIVERHRGSIEVESTLGCGTDFTVCLPVNSKDSQSTETQP